MAVICKAARNCSVQRDVNNGALLVSIGLIRFEAASLARPFREEAFFSKNLNVLGNCSDSPEPKMGCDLPSCGWRIVCFDEGKNFSVSISQ
jgi:hypothetical protein